MQHFRIGARKFLSAATSERSRTLTVSRATLQLHRAAGQSVRPPARKRFPSDLTHLTHLTHLTSVAAALLCSAFLLAGCHSPVPSQSLHRFEFTNPQMGTLFRITLYAADEAAARTAANAAFLRVAALDDIMSDYQADSELMRLCSQPCLK